jgi:choline dehydrogenase-like flavoprotein
MGGIENSRYLLWFQEKYGEKFISKSVPLGRYWMEHPHFALGYALVDRRKVSDPWYSLSPEAQFDNQILNCGFSLQHLNEEETEKLINDVLYLAPTFGRKLYSLADKNLIIGSKLRAVWEQSPDYENRVQLDSKTDRFGIPKAVLYWRKTAFDRRTIVKSVSEFNDWLLQADAGRIQLNEWILNNKDYPDNDELAGNHHMGGTRMHEDQRFGVVNSNLKVYGVENLFIAGSSIFTTGGHNNPTLPIVQFSLKLAEHLSK